MSDVHDGTDCPATDDTSRLFSLKTGSTWGSSLRQNLTTPVELSDLSALKFHVVRKHHP